MRIEFIPFRPSDGPPGHLPASRYARRYWSPLIGVVALGFLALVSDHLDEGKASMSPAEIAAGLALENVDSLAAPIASLVRAGLAAGKPGTLAVCKRLPTLDSESERRLPPILREEHRRRARERLYSTANTLPASGARGRSGDKCPSPSPASEMLELAGATALSMLRLGAGRPEIDSALARRGYHPSIAHRAIEWALVERDRSRKHERASSEAARDAIDEGGFANGGSVIAMKRRA